MLCIFRLLLLLCATVVWSRRGGIGRGRSLTSYSMDVKGLPLVQDTLHSTVEPLGLEWSLEFYVKPIGPQRGLANVFHSTVRSETKKDSILVINSRWDKHARSANLEVLFKVNGIKSQDLSVLPLLNPDNYNKIVMTQRMDGQGSYIFSIHMNDRMLESFTNNEPLSYPYAAAYLSSPWRAAANLLVGGLRYGNGRFGLPSDGDSPANNQYTTTPAGPTVPTITTTTTTTT